MQSTGGYWSGVNAATMTLLIGQEERAAELAKRVRAQCQQTLSRRDADEYWVLAAMAICVGLGSPPTHIPNAEHITLAISDSDDTVG